MLPLPTGWPHNGILTNEKPLCHLQQLTKGFFSLLMQAKDSHQYNGESLGKNYTKIIIVTHPQIYQYEGG